LKNKKRIVETAGYNTSMRVLKLIDQVWRLFAIALCFTVFGIGGLIMGLILFPLMFVFIRDTERRSVRARRLIGKAFGGFWGLMNVLGVLDYRIEGRENIDIHRNQLVVANHPTLIDVVILISLFPRANCVIKEAVTKNIFMRSVVRAADYLSNSAPEDLLESCVEYLEKGGSLMLFPEGTRTEQGKAIDFKPGAATVAARSRVDVLPVVIRCEPHFQSKELPWFFVSHKRPTFTIRVLAPMRVEDLTTVDAGEREMRHELNDNLLAHMKRGLTSVEFSE
jgi:1-acyl-sn-glycerol-3-phosphate acyltransferase